MTASFTIFHFFSSLVAFFNVISSFSRLRVRPRCRWLRYAGRWRIAASFRFVREFFVLSHELPVIKSSFSFSLPVRRACAFVFVWRIVDESEAARLVASCNSGSRRARNLTFLRFGIFRNSSCVFFERLTEVRKFAPRRSNRNTP